MACRLIALNICPGVLLIGISNTARRLIAKAVLYIVEMNIQDAAGCLQLCTIQLSGCKAAFHSVWQSFSERGCYQCL